MAAIATKCSQTARYTWVSSLEYPHLIENSTVADRLYNEVRLTCFVLTYNDKDGVDKRAKAVQNSWAHRCNKVVYISSGEGK